MLILVSACYKSSTIEIRNNTSNDTILNVFWGEVPLATELFPGGSSGKTNLYEDAQYNLDFPESLPVFYTINHKGKMIPMTTIEKFSLGKDDDLVIIIDDSTEVSRLSN